MHLRALVVAGCLIVAACGAKSPTAPSILDISGVWHGTTTLTGAQSTSGDCTAAVYIAGFGGVPTAETLTVQQSGTGVSGTLVGDASGASCAYTGTISGSDYSVVFNVNSCTLNGRNNVLCNGVFRDTRLASSAATGTATTSSITGTDGDSYTVFFAGTLTQLASMTTQSSFSFSR